MTDFETWVLDNSDRVYRYWVYKKMFTPYEQDQKFTDETCYECEECSFGCIQEAIELPDGDILLGFIDPADYDTSVDGYLDFHKLSEIHLEYSPLDQDAQVDWEQIDQDAQVDWEQTDPTASSYVVNRPRVICR